MKKILLGAAAVLVGFSFSCNSPMTGAESTMDQQTRKNLAAFQTIDSAFQTGDVSRIDSVVAEDFLDHRDTGDVRSRDSLKALINLIHTNYKDMKMEVRRTLADSSFVMGWEHYTGTGDGVMMPPGPFEMDMIEGIRFENGKAVEHWAFGEMQDMARMMRPQMQTVKKVDSTKVQK